MPGTQLRTLCALLLLSGTGWAQESPSKGSTVPEKDLQTVESAQEVAISESANEAEMPAPDAGSAGLPKIISLEEAERRALSDNPSLRSVEARIAQAEALVRQARSAYFPRVDSSYSATHTELPDASVDAAKDAVVASALSSVQRSAISLLTGPQQLTTGSVIGIGQSLFQAKRALGEIDDSIDTFQLGVTASYLLFDGFARKYRVAATEFGRDQTEAAQREAKRLLLDAVARSFYGVQLARENIEIAKADEAFNERLLKESKLRYGVGAGALSDVLNFEVRVRASRALLLQARRDFDVTRIALAALMGIPSALLPEGTEIAQFYSETPEEMARPEVDALVAYALAHRPDVEQSALSLQRAEAVIGQRRADYYPQVSAFVAHETSRPSNSAFRSDEFSTFAGVALNYNLYAGGQRKASVEEARHAKTEAVDLLESAKLTAVSEVRQALANLTTAQEQLVLQRATTEYVDKNRDLVEKEYKVGQGALALLNQAQRDLTESQARLALARVSLRLAWYQLRTSTAQTIAAL